MVMLYLLIILQILFGYVFTKPIQIIDITEDGKMVATERGIAFLSGLSGNIKVVSVLGGFQLGKSFMLNKIMMLPLDNSFEVGNTAKPETKGIWVMDIRYCSNKNKNNVPAIVSDCDNSDDTILFLDVEGLESGDRSDSVDNMLAIFVTYMSNVIIFNSVIHVNRSGPTTLLHIAQICREIFGFNSSHDKKGEEFTPPGIIWTVQQAIVAMNENDIAEYKEELDIFNSLDLISIPHPVEKISDLPNLPKMKYNDLARSYRDKIEGLRNVIVSDLKKKKGYTAEILVRKMQLLLDSFKIYNFALHDRKEFIPIVRRKSVELFKGVLNKAYKSAPYPMREKELIHFLNDTKKEAYNQAGSIINGIYGELREKLDKKYTSFADYISTENFKRISKNCSGLFTKLEHYLSDGLNIGATEFLNRLDRVREFLAGRKSGSDIILKQNSNDIFSKTLEFRYDESDLGCFGEPLEEGLMKFGDPSGPFVRSITDKLVSEIIKLLFYMLSVIFSLVILFKIISCIDGDKGNNKNNKRTRIYEVAVSTLLILALIFGAGGFILFLQTHGIQNSFTSTKWDMSLAVSKLLFTSGYGTVLIYIICHPEFSVLCFVGLVILITLIILLIPMLKNCCHKENPSIRKGPINQSINRSSINVNGHSNIAVTKNIGEKTVPIQQQQPQQQQQQQQK